MAGASWPDFMMGIFRTTSGLVLVLLSGSNVARSNVARSRPVRHSICSRQINEGNVLGFDLCSRHFIVRIRDEQLQGLKQIVMPREANEGLYLKLFGKTVRIRSMASLRGKLDVKSAQDAMGVARLRTSRDTFYLLSDGLQGEIRESPDAVLRPVGDLAGEFPGGIDTSGLFGVVRPGEMTELGLFPPSVRRVAGGFQVSRFALDPSLNPCPVVHLVETIGRDASYHCKEFPVTSGKVGKHPWNFVYFR